MKLKDKVALVTGGARGIGAAIADRYVAEGARVVVADISLGHAEETAARHGDKALAIALDVTKTTSIEAAVESVVRAMGRRRHPGQQRRRSSTWRRSSR